MAETVPMPSVWTGGTVDPEAGDLITHTCVGLAGGVIALLFVWMYTREIEAFPDGPPGNDRTQIRFTAEKIHSGAVAFLHAEYSILAKFVVVVGIALLIIEGVTLDWDSGLYTMLCFYFGAILSAGAGYLGMHVATLANSRTAWACNVDQGGSLNKGLRVAFKSGSVMGLGVVGSGILGVIICSLALQDVPTAWSHISGFVARQRTVSGEERAGAHLRDAALRGDLVGAVRWLAVRSGGMPLPWPTPLRSKSPSVRSL